MTVTILMPNLLRQACRLLPAAGQVAGKASMATRPTEEFSMAFVTAPNSEKAKEIAAGLVSGKLAACVNIVPGVISGSVQHIPIQCYMKEV